MGKDIKPLLDGWEFKSNKISVRKIRGADGIMKLQLRLDLGLLQMELIGRPDGQKPYGYESLLEYYEDLLADHQKKFDAEHAFQLDAEACAELQRECIQYYHRYLSLFQIGDYKGVVRDTRRNVRVFDLVKEYAKDEQKIGEFEQYRSYVIMMNVRASVHLCLKKNKYREALEQISEGINAIRKCYEEYDQYQLGENSREIRFLENWLDEIKENQPLGEVEKIKIQMERAVETEDYERAAILRDKLKSMLEV